MQDFIKSKACFGYEQGCRPEDSYDHLIAQCTGLIVRKGLKRLSNRSHELASSRVGRRAQSAL